MPKKVLDRTPKGRFLLNALESIERAQRYLYAAGEYGRADKLDIQRRAIEAQIEFSASRSVVTASTPGDPGAA